MHSGRTIEQLLETTTSTFNNADDIDEYLKHKELPAYLATQLDEPTFLMPPSSVEYLTYLGQLIAYLAYLLTSLLKRLEACMSREWRRPAA